MKRAVFGLVSFCLFITMSCTSLFAFLHAVGCRHVNETLVTATFMQLLASTNERVFQRRQSEQQSSDKCSKKCVCGSSISRVSQ
jgi:hypothetical protein